MSKARVRILIEGKVQGVFFRQNTKEAAQLRNVKGWIRNLPSGKVEALFEGDKEAVQEMVDFCRIGPRGSYVTKIDLTREEYTGEFSDFQIMY